MTYTERWKSALDTIRATAGLGRIFVGALAETAVDVILGRELPHPKAVHPVDGADAIRVRTIRSSRSPRVLDNDEAA
jgi:hypothetical protein